ncbi:hypothetical protein HK099_008074 [Clydaea vesicula]|uniref:Essential protein Yae1 N-terminal domain-containing protein n=1 Tax=Clydaea vesicula TaxID=447962 RepID=A0AAD5XXR3_9FUNG|nr:hypothetical protein HK099_008074 [Clydaea vesicula]KAJ3387512.1 hypothetical protein HDU92_001921 [Lobulomyces angularis]
MENLLSLEEMFINAGYDNGYEKGVMEGFVDGLLLGSKQAFQLLKLVNFIQGVCTILLLPYQKNNGELRIKANRHLVNLIELCENFPTDNSEKETDLNALVIKIIAKFKLVKTTLQIEKNELSLEKFIKDDASVETKNVFELDKNVVLNSFRDVNSETVIVAQDPSNPNVSNSGVTITQQTFDF